MTVEQFYIYPFTHTHIHTVQHLCSFVYENGQFVVQYLAQERERGRLGSNH